MNMCYYSKKSFINEAINEEKLTIRQGGNKKRTRGKLHV